MRLKMRPRRMAVSYHTGSHSYGVLREREVRTIMRVEQGVPMRSGELVLKIKKKTAKDPRSPKSTCIYLHLQPLTRSSQRRFSEKMQPADL